MGGPDGAGGGGSLGGRVRGGVLFLWVMSIDKSDLKNKKREYIN